MEEYLDNTQWNMDNEIYISVEVEDLFPDPQYQNVKNPAPDPDPLTLDIGNGILDSKTSADITCVLHIVFRSRKQTDKLW